MRKIIFISILFLANILQASQCDIFGRINEAGLGENPQFWEEFAELSAKGDVPETAVANLMKKYSASTPASTGSAGAAAAASTAPKAFLAGSQRIDVRRDAVKSYERAPVQVQHKADELVALFNSKGNKAIQDLHHHNWNYEFIDQHKKHSVRLNGGYRAMITIEGDKLTIWDIGKNVYHH